MRLLTLIGAGLVMAASLGGAPRVARGQGAAADVDRDRGHRMLRQLRATLDEYYYDSTFGGRNLDRMQAVADSAIDAAPSLPAIVGALAQFLQTLDDSHTFLLPPGLNVSVQYGWTWYVIGEDCYVATVREKSDAEAQGLKVGDKVLAIDGIRPTRGSMWLIGYVYYRLSPRPGMRLTVRHADGTEQTVVIKSVMKREQTVRDFSDLEAQRRFVEETERSRPRHRVKTYDSVMVWRMPAFIFEDREVDRIMERARNYAWLILDLRGNGGGSVATEQRLIGYFFDARILAYTEVQRDTVVPQWIKPSSKKPFTGQLVILIDSESASAAEITSRVLQMHSRATVVGDRSAGAVMTSIRPTLTLGSVFQERVLPFGMSVTVTDVVMPDSSRIEKVGVIPNVTAVPTGADLAAKRDPTLQFALEMAGVKLSAEAAAQIFGK